MEQLCGNCGGKGYIRLDCFHGNSGCQDVVCPLCGGSGHVQMPEEPGGTPTTLKILRNSRECPEPGPDFLNMTLGQCFDMLLKETGLTKGELLARANIAPGYGYHLLAGDDIANKDYYLLLALALAPKLPKETRLKKLNRMIALAGYGALHPLSFRDGVMINAIEHGYDRVQVDETLRKYKLPPLEDDEDSGKRKRRGRNPHEKEK